MPPKKKTESTSDARRLTIDELAAEINKSLGDHVLIRGSEAKLEVPHTTTGILAYDLALGGGYAANQWNEIVGEECLAPGSLVLTDALQWVPVEHLQVGDPIVGFDEDPAGRGKGATSCFRKATVTSLGRAVLPSYRLRTTVGDVTASAGHLWLVHRDGRRRWVRTDELASGNSIAAIGPVWDTAESYVAGWLSGFYDGEGWLSSIGVAKTGGRVGVAQVPGPTADKLISSLEFLGYSPHVYEKEPAKEGWQSKVSVQLAGRYEDMRFVGSIRPERLLSKSDELWVGKSTKQVHQSSAVVLSVEPLGDLEVVTIGTSTKTLVVNGMLSHNSSGKTALAYKAVAANQYLDEEFLTLWVAAEEFVPEYAESFGVDLARLWVVESNEMESVLDLVLKAVSNRAVDMVVIDSLPALVTVTEVNKDMDEASVATGAQILSRFFKKCSRAQRRSLIDADRPCTLIAINQWRDKIGVMFGDPRTTPGGKAKNYYFFTRIEVRRDEWVQEVKSDNETRVGQVIKMRTIKNKTYRPQQAAEVTFFFADSKVLGFRKGDFDVAKDIVNVCLALDVFEGRYKFEGERIASNKEDLYVAVRQDIGLQNRLSEAARMIVLAQSVTTVTELEGEPPTDEEVAEDFAEVLA